MVSSYLIPVCLLLSLKFSLVQSQQYAGEYCGSNFAIYENKIIRTEDSKKLGAKYLTSQDVTSRLECLKLCCVTHTCDVFVYEEKIPGTCYMFACGPPDDFRCQFTSHGNYTSAVLTQNKLHSAQGGQLEEEIRLNQHETELTRLRQPMDNLMKEMIPPSPALPSSTTPSPLPTPAPSTQPEPIHISTQRTKCSRYQFECHTSKECIAIYNVCDGIPQCMDGSDEAVELACPSTALRPTPTSAPHHREPAMLASNDLPPHAEDFQPHNEELLPPEIQTRSPPFSRMMPSPQKLMTLEEQQVLQAQQQAQQRLNSMIMPNQQNIQWPSNSQIQYNKEMSASGFNLDPNSGVIYRPGVGSASIDYDKPSPVWQQHAPYHANNNAMLGVGVNNRIFNHNNNNNIPMQSPDYPGIDPSLTNNNNVQYKMSNMSPYGPYMQGYQHIAAPQHSGINNMDMSPVHQMSAYNNNNHNNNNRLPAEYYYDDTTHQQTQVLPQPVSGNVMEHELSPAVNNIVQQSVSLKKQDPPLLQVTLPPPSHPLPVGSSSTVHPPHHRKEKHSRKNQQLSTEILIKEETVSSEQYESFYPSSAIIVFTFGLFLTVTLAILLCCRLKMIRRRLRKGGKSAYAHDADFLVNGMYL